MASDFSSNDFLALFKDVALEVETEHKKNKPPSKKPKCPEPGQLYNPQGQPLYRTRVSDPTYFAQLDAKHAASERNASFEQARRRSMG